MSKANSNEINIKPFVEIFNDDKQHSLTDYAKALNLARERYTESKYDYEKALNEVILETNFDDINETRKSMNLPKLSNKEQREAYWKDQVLHIKEEMDRQYDYYIYCKNMFKILINDTGEVGNDEKKEET